MGLITKRVTIKIISSNYKYYEDKGYTIPKYYDVVRKRYRFVKSKTFIEVDVNDLPPGSKVIVQVSCDHCGKVYSISYRYYLKNIKKFDNKIYCNNCVRSLFHSKENHPRWDPTRTDEERQFERRYYSYDIFINSVLERDNYTCQCCGIKSNKPVVHHLDSYNWCTEKRTDVTNGITLCENCHEEFHRIYGKGDNTKEQFEEWLGVYRLNLSYYKSDVTKYNKLLYCFEENKVYNSVANFCKKYPSTKKESIYKVCNHKDFRFTVDGKHFLWVSEILSLTNEEIDNRINSIHLVNNRVHFTEEQRNYVNDYVEKYNSYYFSK